MQHTTLTGIRMENVNPSLVALATFIEHLLVYGGSKVAFPVQYNLRDSKKPSMLLYPP